MADTDAGAVSSVGSSYDSTARHPKAQSKEHLCNRRRAQRSIRFVESESPANGYLNQTVLPTGALGENRL